MPRGRFVERVGAREGPQAVRGAHVVDALEEGLLHSVPRSQGRGGLGARGGKRKEKRKREQEREAPAEVPGANPLHPRP